MFTCPFSATLVFPTSYDYKDQWWRYGEPIYTSSVRDTKGPIVLMYRAGDIWDPNWCPQYMAGLRKNHCQEWLVSTWSFHSFLFRTHIFCHLSMSNIYHKNYPYLVLSILLMCFSFLLQTTFEQTADMSLHKHLPICSSGRWHECFSGYC